jgi:hypothetical protein
MNQFYINFFNISIFIMYIRGRGGVGGVVGAMGA